MKVEAFIPEAMCNFVTTATFTQEQTEVSKYLCHPFFQIYRYLLGHSSQRTKLWNLEIKMKNFQYLYFLKILISNPLKT